MMTKVHIVKTMVFPVVIYGCESWAINNAKHQKKKKKKDVFDCGIGEDCGQSLGLQEDQINQS